MKSVVIVHGWDGGPEEPMLQWVKDEFEKRGYKTIVPAMPHPATPTIEDWVAKLKEVVPNEGEITLVGHSIGCQTILRYIEVLEEDEKIAKLILIAPWMALDMNTIEEEGEEVKEIAKPWMETPIDFTKVRRMVGETLAIFSDNDPYVPLSQKDLFEKKLGAKVVVEHNKGHFDPYSGTRELPSVF